MSPRRPPMACAEAVRQLWLLLDGDLDAADRVALDAHLDWCLRCCGELAFAEHLQEMLRARAEVTIPAGARHRLESFIDDLLAPTGEES